MITLAFDSTAKKASVAICDGERLLGLFDVDNGFTHSELLLPMAEDVLKSLKLSFNDIELFATCTGPGSFTGVRIGAALVKGLAFGRQLPCVSVSTLESLAENLAGCKGLILPCMDARRNQVYTAIFRSDGETITRLTEDMAIPVSELSRILQQDYADERIYLVGDGYCTTRCALEADGVKTESTPPLARLESAYSCALVAYRKYLKGEYTTDLDISPTYLRMPQAERERLERLEQENKTKEVNNNG